MKIVINEGLPYSNGGRNKLADAGLHMQDKAENDLHLTKLEREYKRLNPLKRIVGRSPAALAAKAALQKEQDLKAKEYAKKEEPKRFLPFLARTMNGIKADKEQRTATVRGVTLRTNPSSSWIKSISTSAQGAPIIVETKNGKRYACPCPWATAEDILKKRSIGKEVGERLFTGKFKIGAAGTKNQGRILHKSNGRVAKIGRL